MKEKKVKDYLVEDFCAKQVNPKEFLGEKVFNHLLQVIDEGYNDGASVVLEENIEVYFVPKTDKSEPFYAELEEGQEDLYLIYDTEHNYMESNSNKFFLEMWLLKGLTLNEVRTKPHLLIDYVQKVRAYFGFYDSLNN